MSDIPSELKYTKTHEWVRVMDDGNLEIGITDHAQSLMGDMVYVELPEVGAMAAAGQDCAVVESVKAASDVYAPVSGEILEVNDQLADAPETLNQHPYADGWMFRMRPESEGELDELLDGDAYQEVIDAEE
jgi:glycine cleavage system H protein